MLENQLEKYAEGINGKIDEVEAIKWFDLAGDKTSRHYSNELKAKLAGKSPEIGDGTTKVDYSDVEPPAESPEDASSSDLDDKTREMNYSFRTLPADIKAHNAAQ